MMDQPPRNKCEPPVAGAITWTQLLLRRLKTTITSFLEVPEMREAEHMKTVSQLIASVYQQMESWASKKSKMRGLLM